MPSITTLHADDPVSRLIDRSTRRHGHFPVPLIATSYDITLAGGLACVTARRTFRNQEASSIEATLTFPMPVHAVLYGLEARVGGRTLKAIAKDKTAARETYEDAVDRGKTAVLHEELLRGIHMLSVAHVAPGTEIEVTARFALPLAWIGGRAMLRIPTTVGHVYGASGMPDCDDLTLGGPVAAADLNVSCEGGASVLVGGVPAAPGLRVPLDQPISVEVKGWTARDLHGRTAAGEAFTLGISPAPEGEAPLDVAFLIDHSGSMNSLCATGVRLSKHAAVLLGLNEAARGFTDADRINLWQFDDVAEDLGIAHGPHAGDLIRMLDPPRGGTEIGRAIAALLAQRPSRDVVLVTDGMSHALDVQALAGTGVRFSVVLIGDDSLEANVGHLAALSGGEIFVAHGADVAGALRSVIASLRAARPAVRPAGDGDHLASVCRGGMQIVASRAAASVAADAPEAARAAGAYVASLRLAHLPAAEAAKLAVAEGLVTHLTSLVLVDEEGVAQAGLPAMRKVDLPVPATVAASAIGPQLKGLYGDLSAESAGSYPGVCRSAAPPCDFADDGPRPAAAFRRRAFSLGRSKAVHVARDTDPASSRSDDASQAPCLTQIPHRIDWRNEGQRLVEGNMIGLPHEIADAIDAAARVGVVKRTAKRVGVSARVLVIGLLARAISGRDRHAERVYRAILARAKTRDIAHVAERLGLASA
jgi:hypothetical protein